MPVPVPGSDREAGILSRCLFFFRDAKRETNISSTSPARAGSWAYVFFIAVIIYRIGPEHNSRSVGTTCISPAVVHVDFTFLVEYMYPAEKSWNWRNSSPM